VKVRYCDERHKYLEEWRLKIVHCKRSVRWRPCGHLQEADRNTVIDCAIPAPSRAKTISGARKTMRAQARRLAMSLDATRGPDTESRYRDLPRQGAVCESTRPVALSPFNSTSSGVCRTSRRPWAG